ncbi:beta-carotene 3-hydroxylase [Pseudomonas duriflava]|uniref:Beta-carotene 3-hydroxylase n=1 Tax=Pseudomonas duriflava TaxID=459528 RepID=A0A562Q8F5_9PSED|nr:sterol desaturase family protein [Pseudomonas duriflava]TWI53009.1 beta-carotene 3-hydroxylase [Pseudomonas duriflava]
MLINTLIVLATIAFMEAFSWYAHKYIMHGWGWGWHKSHHEPRTGWFEKNDLYAVVFAGIAIMLIYFGTEGYGRLEWVGAGMTAYGLLYFIAHDGLVHQRWPFKYVPRRGYLKRLYQAHRMHHAVDGKEGCVSFGFLYAPSVSTLKKQLRELHQGPLKRQRSESRSTQTGATACNKDKARSSV